MTKLAALLSLMADLDVLAGRFQDAAAHLREGLQVVLRTGDLWETGNGMWSCGWLCAATGRYAEAATLWAAHAVHYRQQGLVGQTPEEARREQAAQARSGRHWDRPGSARLKSAARR